MFYTIYKTNNIINGKYYIGKHQTKDLNDGYLGSGKYLKRAIAKYGLSNFHKEILHICSTEKEMNLLEKILVVPDSELNYNLCQGGKGGFGYINKNIMTKEMLSKAGKAGGALAGEIMKNKCKNDPVFKKYFAALGRKNIKANLHDKLKIRFKDGNGWTGRKHSDKSKQKISKSIFGKNVGTLNSQYGTCWITNGINNKKIKKDSFDNWLELGYNKGRVCY